MDKALYDKGMAMRRKVLGDEYVDRAVANTDDFNREFQELLTELLLGRGVERRRPQAARPQHPQSRHDRLPRPHARIRGAFPRRAAQWR